MVPVPTQTKSPVGRWLPARTDMTVFAALLAGWLVLYVPTYADLARTIWSRDEQGHGPIILALAIWMLWRLRDKLADLPPRPAPLAGAVFFALAMLLYVVGRSQAVQLFEAGSQIPLLIALLLTLKGPRALRVAWFPLFFLLFMVPLPSTFVATITTPLKSAVSAVASDLLYAAGYPIGRTGVVLTIGQYQLLVADACAGLNSMFTLEALGLLYLQLVQHASVARNVLLAVVIVPISFVANVVRVIVLVLVTYYFGDEAGQGFVHGFAGMVLFLVALSLILSVDGAANVLWHRRAGRPA